MRISDWSSDVCSSEHLFGSARPMQFEIGFGGGEHMAAQAKAHPGHGFIGCEPFLNGVVAALGHIRDGGLSNVRIHMGDALDVQIGRASWRERVCQSV